MVIGDAAAKKPDCVDRHPADFVCLKQLYQPPNIAEACSIDSRP